MVRYLSLGFDDERPYGDFAKKPEGRKFRKEKWEFLERMNDLFDANAVERTHFILTKYLQEAEQATGAAMLKDLYFYHEKLEIAQHSHSHGIIAPLRGVNQKVMTAEQFTEDVRLAGDLIHSILGVRPKGLRTPYGYETDLSEHPDVLKGLENAGISYVSSDLGMKLTLEGALTKERQPHRYEKAGFPYLVEVPAHGLQDVVFTKQKAKQLFNKDEPPSPEEAFAHYDSLLDQAKRIEAQRVSVALCLHPWAVMEYDPQVTLLMKLVDSARAKGFRILSYEKVAKIYRMPS